MYDQRDQTEHGPRDGLMHDLDFPRGDARELVIDGDRAYELNGEDSRTLAAVGAFRVVPERDLGRDRDENPDHDTLDHILAFAERVLPRAADLWVQASLEQRQRFQQVFFPDGIAFDGKCFVGTRVTAPAFSYLREIETEK